ncbi:MAG: hypothetical protein ACXIU7_01730 [Roseinatronobacter sp.]
MEKLEELLESECAIIQSGDSQSLEQLVAEKIRLFEAIEAMTLERKEWQRLHFALARSSSVLAGAMEGVREALQQISNQDAPRSWVFYDLDGAVSRQDPGTHRMEQRV